MKKLDKYILVLVLILLITGVLLESLNKDRIEITSPSDYVRIDSLQFCGVASLSENRHKVSICGSVVAEKQSIPIRMYLYRMPSETLVAQNQVGERFSTGEFIREFDLPGGNNYGSYKFVAYFYKEVVGKLEFEIQSP
jgi:hypothetical protein